MKVHRASRFLFVLGAAVTPAALLAQGFGVNEIGACSTARAFANTGAPCKDASVIYWNPAAATLLSGWSAQVGVSSIAVKGSFSQDTTGYIYKSTEPAAYVPSAFVNYRRPGSKASWGIGMYVPYGLTSEWDNNFPGRFVAQKAAIKSIYIQPNFAWQLHPRWSVGGGPIFGTSSVELVQALDLSQQAAAGTTTFGQLGIAANTQFATARLKGNATAYGAQVGVFGQPTNDWSVGARFMTPMTFDYKNADATFTQVPTNLVLGGTILPPVLIAGRHMDSVVAPSFAAGGPLGPQKAETKILHPAQIQAGVGYTGYKDWLLTADYSWVGWRQFDQMVVTFNGAAPTETIINDYNHSSAIRLAAEYSMPTNGTKLRAGFSGVASAAPPETVTPLLPEQDRNYYTVGVGLPPFHGYSLDLGYARTETPGARGRIVGRTSRTQTADQLNTGVYKLSANILSATLKASF